MDILKYKREINISKAFNCALPNVSLIDLAKSWKHEAYQV